MADAERIVRVTIRGLVQGVGYRAWTEIEAERRAIRGFVRNRLNGNVEAVFAGLPEAVQSLCEACRKGPRLADVESVEIEDVDASVLDGLGAGFRQLATL
jgi:Acylphosphatases